MPGCRRGMCKKPPSHADPRTIMRYDRARNSLDRHATYIVATYIAGAARLLDSPDPHGQPGRHRGQADHASRRGYQTLRLRDREAPLGMPPPISTLLRDLGS